MGRRRGACSGITLPLLANLIVVVLVIAPMQGFDEVFVLTGGDGAAFIVRYLPGRFAEQIALYGLARVTLIWPPGR